MLMIVFEIKLILHVKTDKYKKIGAVNLLIHEIELENKNEQR